MIDGINKTLEKKTKTSFYPSMDQHNCFLLKERFVINFFYKLIYEISRKIYEEHK